MNTIEYFNKGRFDQLQLANVDSDLSAIRQNAFNTFSKMGIPTTRHEDWKYTRISGLFNKEYQFEVNPIATAVSVADVNAIRLPGYEQANELVFVNGRFSFSLSTIRSANQLIVLPLEEAARNEYKDIVSQHLGHSSYYVKDGIHALNTAFVYGGVFVYVKKGQARLNGTGTALEYPIYIYNISDARISNTFSQPRSLVYLSENAQVQLVETFATLGLQESFTNQVMEIIVEKDARMEYYKIQHDADHTNQVSTTHIRQIGKSYTHTVTISLSGAIVRNNLNIVLEAEHCESYLYGLYLLKGQSHIDNHTVVDNVKPNCFSKELYKGIMDDNATGVFNGKIFVRQQAQKTLSYQSNKNILISDTASVNTKPQLEIFADDVKCSHGCTVGCFDNEALFYLRTRGISEKNAKSLLLHAFAVDILENIKLASIRIYVDQLISERLEFDIA